MQLKEALGLERGAMISFIGAAGETTTMFRLAQEPRGTGCKVLVTRLLRLTSRPNLMSIVCF